jgi:TatD DNase family protein
MTDLRYFDAHCHVQFDPYDADRAELLARMEERGVGGLVVGVDAASSRKAADLAEEHPHLWSSVGLHPNDSEEAYDEHEFRNLLMYPKAVAIGECGLDYFRPADTGEETKKRQRDTFERQIALAGQTGRPLIVHARPSKGTMDAYEDALDLLASAKKEYGDKLRGDFHFFVGDTDVARKAFGLDFTVSYTAVITFARDYDEAVRFAPLTHLLSETDAPYVAPASRRGQRNDPLAVEEVVAALAGIRGEDLETVREATLRNALGLFRIEP